MEAIPIYKYCHLGTVIRFLQDVYVEQYIFREGMIFDNIEFFLARIDELNLHVTKKASFKLEMYRDKLKKKLETQNKNEIKTTKLETNELRKIINVIRGTFDAEASGIYSYSVKEKRVEIEKLINNIDKLFSHDVFDNMPTIAQYDFNEAGKCIAFERSTAAAFHILRGTESTLRLYYTLYFRKKVGDLNWGDIINQLRGKKTRKKPDDIIINQLNFIKKKYRNPTQHPDKIYDIEEAQDLLNLCIDVNKHMMKEFIKRKKITHVF